MNQVQKVCLLISFIFGLVTIATMGVAVFTTDMLVTKIGTASAMLALLLFALAAFIEFIKDFFL